MAACLMIAETRSERSDINPCIASSRAIAGIRPAAWRRYKGISASPFPPQAGGERRLPYCLATKSKAPHQSDKAALHLDAVGSKDARFKSLVRRLERDRCTAAA